MKRFIKSVGKGLLKVMSKMGISTYQSYCGAADLRCGRPARPISFPSSSPVPRPGSKVSRWRRSRKKSVRRHRDAFADVPIYRDTLDVGGEYAFPCARRGSRLDGRDRVGPAARGARQLARPISDLRADHQRAERTAADDPRPVPASALPRTSAASRCRSTRSSRR